MMWIFAVFYFIVGAIWWIRYVQIESSTIRDSEDALLVGAIGFCFGMGWPVFLAVYLVLGLIPSRRSKPE